MPKGSFAVALLSTRNDGKPMKVSFKLADIGLTDEHAYNVTDAIYLAPFGIFAPHDTFNLYAHPTGVAVLTALVLP